MKRKNLKRISKIQKEAKKGSLKSLFKQITIDDPLRIHQYNSQILENTDQQEKEMIEQLI